MSRDQYSRMWQQLCGVNNFFDMRGSIYPKIKIMAVWCQIHHSGHTPPRIHDLPKLCDFPDVSWRGENLLAMGLYRWYDFGECLLVDLKDVR